MIMINGPLSNSYFMFGLSLPKPSGPPSGGMESISLSILFAHGPHNPCETNRNPVFLIRPSSMGSPVLLFTIAFFGSWKAHLTYSCSRSGLGPSNAFAPGGVLIRILIDGLFACPGAGARIIIIEQLLSLNLIFLPLLQTLRARAKEIFHQIAFELAEAGCIVILL